MVLWFNQTGGRRHRKAISPLNGFHGNIGLFFAVLEKLGRCQFLWWSEVIRIKVDFERREIEVELEWEYRGRQPPVARLIPFGDFLTLSYEQIVEQHMRPFAGALARFWELPKTAEVIEAGAANVAIEETIRKECRKSAEWHCIALTNLLRPDGEVPWQDTDFASAAQTA